MFPSLPGILKISTRDTQFVDVADFITNDHSEFYSLSNPKTVCSAQIENQQG